jgi:hypothetical protein
MKKSLIVLLIISLFYCEKSRSHIIQKTLQQDSSIVHKKAVLNNLKPFHYLKPNQAYKTWKT